MKSQAMPIFYLTFMIFLSVQSSVGQKLQILVSAFYPAVNCKEDSLSLSINGIQIDIMREAFSFLNYKENTDYSFTCEKNYKELTNSIQDLSFLTNTTFQVGMDTSGISTSMIQLGYRYSQPIFSGNYVVMQQSRLKANYFTNTVKAYIILLFFVAFIATYYALKKTDSERLGWLEYSFITFSSFFLNREPLINHAKTRSILYGFQFFSGITVLFIISVFIYDLMVKQNANIYEYSQLQSKSIYTLTGETQASQIISLLNAREIYYTKFNVSSYEYLDYFYSQRAVFSLHKEFQALTLLSSQCDGSMHLISLPYYQYDSLIYNQSVDNARIQLIDKAILQSLKSKSIQQRAREYQSANNQICLASPADYIRFFYAVKYLDLWGLFLILWLLPLIWFVRKTLLAYYKKYHPEYYKRAKAEGIIDVISYDRAKNCGDVVNKEINELYKNIEKDLIKRDEEGIDPLVEYLLDDRQIPMEQIKQAYDKSKTIDFEPFRRNMPNLDNSFNSSRSNGFYKSQLRFKGYIKNPGDSSIDRNHHAFDSIMHTNQEGLEMTPLQDYFKLRFGQTQPENSNQLFFQTLNRKHENQQEGIGLVRLLSSIKPPNDETNTSLLHLIGNNNSHDNSLQFGSLIQSDEEKKNRFRFNIVKQPKNQQGDGQILSSQIKSSNLRQGSLPLINPQDEDEDMLDNQLNQNYYQQYQNLKKQKSKLSESDQNNSSKIKLKQNNFMDMGESPTKKDPTDRVINLDDNDNDVENQYHPKNMNAKSGTKGKDKPIIPFEHKGKENMFIRNIKRSHSNLPKLNEFVHDNHEDLEQEFKADNPNYRAQPSAKLLLEELEQQSASYRLEDEKNKRKILEHQKIIVDNFFEQQKVMEINNLDNDITVEVLTFRDNDNKSSKQVYDLDAHRQYSSNKSTKR